MHIIKRHGAAMEASEMGVASRSEGIVMTDREKEVQRPSDANGMSLNQLQIVQIMEVPTYLVSGLLDGDDGEKELAQRIKSLKLDRIVVPMPVVMQGRFDLEPLTGEPRIEHRRPRDRMRRVFGGAMRLPWRGAGRIRV